MFSPEERVNIAREESERLKTYLAGLPAEAWSKPSACDRWEVGDVVAHLALACGGYAGNITRALQGNTSPAPAPSTASPGNTSQPAPDLKRRDRIAQSTLSFRESLTVPALDTFIERNGQLLSLLADLKPEDWDKPCFHGFKIVTIQTLVTYTILELTLHSWDIRSQLEASAPLAPDSLGVVVEHFPDYLHWSFAPGEPLESPVIYRFELTGGLAARKDFNVLGDRAWVENASDSPASVGFHCDAEIFGLMLCGRVGLESAVERGLITIEGDPRVARTFGDWFKFQQLGEA